MRSDNLESFPEWDDSQFRDDGDEWKTKPGREAAKALHQEWRKLAESVFAFMDMLADDDRNPEKETEQQSIKRLIHENITLIGPKIGGAASVELYLVKMENASIIRTNAIQLLHQIRYAEMMNYVGKEYCEVLVKEVEEFRSLFKKWVATFVKDDFEDEWGLYL